VEFVAADTKTRVLGLSNGDVNQQSADVGKALSPDDDATRRANFRGLSALRFLGLDRDHPGSKARKRLEKFYRDNGIFTLENGDQPAWW
jgi:hypothetical protein